MEMLSLISTINSNSVFLFVFSFSSGLSKFHTDTWMSHHYHCQRSDVALCSKKNLRDSFFYGWYINPCLSQSLLFLHVNSYYLRRTSFQKIILFQHYPKSQAQYIPYCCTSQIPMIWHELFPPDILFQTEHWLLVKRLKIMFSTQSSWNIIFHFKEDSETRGLRNRVIPKKNTTLMKIEAIFKHQHYGALSHFIQFQLVKKTILKSHVASLVVFSCVPLFMNLSNCSLRQVFCLFSLYWLLLSWRNQ